MPKLTKKHQKTITQFEIKTVKNYRYAVATYLLGGIKRTVEFDVTDIRDFIKDNIENYKGWFDQNYSQWEQDNNTELAIEMAAHTWKADWMISDYIDSLIDTAMSGERKAA